MEFNKKDENLWLFEPRTLLPSSHPTTTYLLSEYCRQLHKGPFTLTSQPDGFFSGKSRTSAFLIPFLASCF